MKLFRRACNLLTNARTLESTRTDQVLTYIFGNCLNEFGLTIVDASTMSDFQEDVVDAQAFKDWKQGLTKGQATG